MAHHATDDAQLYREHFGAAVRLAYLLTGDMHRAEDVAQEAFLRSATRRAALRSTDRFGAYLRRATVNGVYAASRAARRERDRNERAGTARPGTPAAALDEEVSSNLDLFGAMGVLTERQRAVVVLRYWADLSEAETARTLRCSRGTVKSTASRALVRLQEEMVARGYSHVD